MASITSVSFAKGHADLLACCAGWLAVLWLVFAWIEASPVLFTAFQGVLGFAVVLAVCAGLERQSWFDRYPDSLSDVRCFQAIAIGLGVFCLAWVPVRIALRKNVASPVLLEPAWLTVDRCVLAILVPLQFVVAVGTITALIVAATHPHLAGELASIGWIAPEQVGATFGAWILLGVLSAAWIASLWEQWPPYALHGVVVLALSVPVLAASEFREPIAAASSLRWGLALCCLACLNSMLAARVFAY